MRLRVKELNFYFDNFHLEEENGQEAGQQCWAINNRTIHWYIFCLSITTNPTRFESECLGRWDRQGYLAAAVGREEPSCGLFQGSHQLIRPLQVPQAGVDSIPGRKKRPAGGAVRIILASVLAQHSVLPTSPPWARPIERLWADPKTSFSFADRGESLTRVSGQIVLCRWLMP